MKSIDELRESDGSISRENIKEIIPYEDPFLFLDRVSFLSKKEIRAEKKIVEDDNLRGHFKGFPIMPGALLVEGLGQAATLLVRNNLNNHLKYDVLAYKILGATFSRPTFPGHTVTYKAKIWFKTKKIAFVTGSIWRNNKRVAKAKMVLAIVDKEKFRGRSGGRS